MSAASKTGDTLSDLRWLADSCSKESWAHTISDNAASEIERLRAALRLVWMAADESDFESHQRDEIESLLTV